ncbi:hypothetical protein RHMOL_Rhmol13G0041800 [Rhododendron molle]|uniref:Uncharacterized protein n=1 Tax=Rhododendron molle TaxID=49168 RepID=A0ACC0L2S9_RHOML|nr:hypothetical protein RHMOL_Rhmol13G0041800 [Rhododendron molle]
MFLMSETKTPGGLLARAVFTSYLKSAHFQARRNDPYDLYTSPDEAIHCPNTSQSMYTPNAMWPPGAQTGPPSRGSVRLGPTPSHPVSPTQLATSNPRLPFRNVQRGYHGLIDPGLHVPDLEEARTKTRRLYCFRVLKGELGKNYHEDLAQYQVLGLCCIRCNDPICYGPGILLWQAAVASTSYGSSECYVGLNLNPICDPSLVIYTIMPNMAYFEFIPQKSNSAKLVDADVEVGQDYELVVTTYGGLYRYRIGDILRVTGFHNSAHKSTSSAERMCC